MPNDSDWAWLKGVGQAALKPFRGSNITEEDETYARLVDQAYSDAPVDTLGDWNRVPELAGDYLQVYDNVDGHRFVAVRGTKARLTDIQQDLKLLETGTPDDVLSEQLRHVLDNTRPDQSVDVGAHSLGTSLVAQAYKEDDAMQDRVRQTYWYNPVFSPFAANNVTDAFESDERVRYFIDLTDLVSIGDLGSKGPSNVVYRTQWTLNPLAAHSVEQWTGAQTDVGPEEVQADVPKQDVVEHSDDFPQRGLEQALGTGVLLDFGHDYDPSTLGF